MKYEYYRLSTNGYGCCNCGAVLHRGDEVLDCADCAGIFCKKCVEDGFFENHKCEPDDAEDCL